MIKTQTGVNVMLSTERKVYLLNRLDREGTIHVKEIARELNISETTIRRDLIELEQEKKVNRVYGGALKVGYENILTEFNETAMSDRMHINFDIKSRICHKACELVQDGECIFLDGGTSIVPMIDTLAKREIKIVTHNHLIVQRIVNPIAQIIIIGGDYNTKYTMSEGPIAENMLRLYNFDRAFIGCAGVDIANNQSYTAEMGTREIKQIAMQNSCHTYLLIDHEKLKIKGFCKFTDIKSFDKIFCDRHETLPSDLPDNFVLVK